MILNTEFDTNIILYALRYSLKRHSYATGLMRDKLDEIWPQISRTMQDKLLDEIWEEKSYNEKLPTIDFIDRIDMADWMSWREKKLREQDDKNLKDIESDEPLGVKPKELKKCGRPCDHYLVFPDGRGYCCGYYREPNSEILFRQIVLEPDGFPLWCPMLKKHMGNDEEED